jgi:hypothetical protein
MLRMFGMLIFGLGLLVWPLGAVYAEEKPIAVPLSYIANLSNTGVATATGMASVWRTDAEVRLTVQGLAVLPTGQTYAVWLVNPSAGRFLSVGRFAVASNGSATVDVSLKGSIAADYSLVLVTVQPDPQTDTHTPSNKYAIVGFFPQNTAIQQQVKHLPDTGQNAEHPPFEPASAIVPEVSSAAGSDKNPGMVAVPLAIAALSIAFVLRRTRVRYARARARRGQ